MITPANHLVIFAKAPRMGRVKSRLACDVGLLAAWQFYRTNLQNTIFKFSSRPGHAVPWKTYLALTPDAETLPGFFPKIPIIKQGHGNLGKRMGHVMQEMPHGPVIIIGTDIPSISHLHISKAFKILGPSDSVIGPAFDGGYWLIGLKRSPRNQMNATHHIFKDVRWSSRHTLEDTLNNLKKRHMSTAMLEPLEDVDDEASYLRWKDAMRPKDAR